METADKIQFIKRYDPDGAARVERLLERKDKLIEGNIYRERYTERQFFLVFNPLLEAAFERAMILECLSQAEDTVSGISERLSYEKDKVFNHLKKLMRENLIEIKGHKGRDPNFCIKG